jgi:hypothetical protein
MGQTFVSVQPQPNGKVLIEAQNKKEVISVLCKNDHVIARLMFIQFKLWLWNLRNSVVDAFMMNGNLSRIKQED